MKFSVEQFSISCESKRPFSAFASQDRAANKQNELSHNPETNVPLFTKVVPHCAFHYCLISGWSIAIIAVKPLLWRKSSRHDYQRSKRESAGQLGAWCWATVTRGSHALRDAGSVGQVWCIGSDYRPYHGAAKSQSVSRDSGVCYRAVRRRKFFNSGIISRCMQTKMLQVYAVSVKDLISQKYKWLKFLQGWSDYVET